MTFGGSSGPVTALRGVLWVGAALVALLWVFLANGHVLFYFDSLFYLDIGDRILKAILPTPDPVTAAGAGSAAEAPATIEGSGANASRSFVFALITGIFLRAQNLGLFALAQALLTVATSLLLAMRLLPAAGPRRPILRLAMLPLIVSAFGALPFYVAYLMPDLLAPLGLLAAAALIIFGRAMSWVELALFWCLAVLSAVSHLSHLALMAALVPVALLAAPLVARRRWWLPALWMASVVLAGMLPILALKLAVSQSTVGEGTEGTITFNPFITARIVVDGPGLKFLDAHCPDARIATCRLHDALSWSDDPWRITASHILFETETPLASYRLLPIEEQEAIAHEQIRFFRMVLAEYPTGVLLSFLRNMMQQAATTSIEMTLPSPPVIELTENLSGYAAEALQHGRVTMDQSWRRFADPAHQVFYALSLAAIFWLLLWRAQVLSSTTRLFVIVVLLGVLANALICGGISQPAPRYGARMAWLLPYLATLLAVLHSLGPPQSGDARS